MKFNKENETVKIVISYTIRFQNTGNDTAFAVIIEDEISEYLNLTVKDPEPVEG